ncbi:hypothetical protein [Jeongeupia sp. HS-3]|uniref:hypothetical protein n=1 Tax=Jeongeupia sp. HS-3 TaxID=1009682 RepID=UPI001910BE9B|nr:hypothetical protein [Jeongeupia sp. HS-3]
MRIILVACCVAGVLYGVYSLLLLDEQKRAVQLGADRALKQIEPAKQRLDPTSPITETEPVTASRDVDFYKCLDSSGRVQYQQEPCAAGTRSVKPRAVSLITVESNHSAPAIGTPQIQPVAQVQDNSAVVSSITHDTSSRESRDSPVCAQLLRNKEWILSAQRHNSTESLRRAFQDNRKALSDNKCPAA